MPAESNILGPARNRVDGRLKVTGAAKYAVEFEVPKCAYGCPVESNIAKGKISAVDLTVAKSAPGALAILTHENAPKPKEPAAKKERNSGHGIRNEERVPLSDGEVHYAGQYVAFVVAETIEQAQHAASLVKVTYAPEEPLLTMEAAEHKASKPKSNHDENVQLKKGDADSAFADAGLVHLVQTYITPTGTHNPIEMSGTIAHWESEDRLTLYDATQFVKGVQSILSRAWNLPTENVRVISPFVGGAFGCKGAVWPHVFLAAMGAKAAGVPVKFQIPRKSMFTSTATARPRGRRSPSPPPTRAN